MDKIVIVEWMDTEDKLDWETIEEVKKYKCPTIYSVGWLIEDNKNHVKICMHDSEGDEDDKEVSTVSTIPKGMVKEIRIVWTKKSSQGGK
jgi:hypothetical protein